jgi:hypothetical protein
MQNNLLGYFALCKTGQALNSLNCHRSEGRTGCCGCKIIYQVTLLCASTRQALNSSKCQRSEGITEVMSLNTPTTPMDMFAKLRKW